MSRRAGSRPYLMSRERGEMKEKEPTLAVWATHTEGLYYFRAEVAQGIVDYESARLMVETTLANGGTVVGWEE